MPPSVIAQNGREFSCFPAAVLVIVVNDDREVLVFSRDVGEYVIVAGGVESDETILDAALRELKEEAGEALTVKPVGIAHVHTFHYDDQVRNMISIYYAMKYQAGDVIPGDDMADAAYQWMPIDDLVATELKIPDGQKWILERAASLVDAYGEDTAPLEYSAQET